MLGDGDDLRRLGQDAQAHIAGYDVAAAAREHALAHVDDVRTERDQVRRGDLDAAGRAQALDDGLEADAAQGTATFNLAAIDKAMAIRTREAKARKAP